MSVETSRFTKVWSEIKQKINMGNFIPLEVVDWGSEIQLQVGDKIKLSDLAL